MGAYTVYHLHSDYSLLDSCSKFSEYIELAVQQGCRAIASTEHGKPLGWVSKKMACDAAGIKFIHGVEIYLTESLSDKVRDNYHTVLLAKNLDGVQEINRVVGIAFNKEHFYYTGRLSFDEFLSLSDNIIKISACLASPLNKLPEGHERYMELARHYDYLEIQPHQCPDQFSYNRRLYALSKEIGVPLIAGTDTHSSSKYKAECRKVLLKRKHKSYGDEDVLDLTWKTREELENAFMLQGALPEEVYMEAIDNTNRMADSVESFELDKSIKYPLLYGSREADSQKFSDVVEQRFQEKICNGIIPVEQISAFRNAIDEEMRVFKKLNMDGFMLSMSDLITWCKNEGMAIGTARGSVGGSRVAYVTDIIDMNPETWHTVFSRFCNEDREEIGDIDIDCVESDRPRIFRYIEQKYGVCHTARVASFGTIADLGFIDDAGGALREYWSEKHPDSQSENPWSYRRIDKIKQDFASNKESAMKKYSELFYYYDGMVGTMVSQSIHPAGIVISPLNLDDEYGVFDKDGDRCLFIDMDELHEVGAAKYDLLVLKTVQVIRDTCASIGVPYPRTHQIDWFDERVWKDMLRSPVGIFQFESPFAFESLKRFAPKSIFDMSLVTAAIRPSGASYRDDLLSRKPHNNPSEQIDELLKDNNGYLVYQEDIIAFLQQVCGLSGSQADTVRRGIARKKMELLEEYLPKIMDGYCSVSDKPRDVAENEAREFLQIIEDASAYMFGYNHSIAYCLLSYLCAYYRYHNTMDFILSFLNNAANSDDISGGTQLAKLYGIKITPPKWGVSRGEYCMDRETKTIAKGLGSVKYMSESIANELYFVSKERKYTSFVDLLMDLSLTSLNSRQRDILIKIDFFSEFGNQRELLTICDMFEFFKCGAAKQIRKDAIAGSPYEDIVRMFSTDKTKNGQESKSYSLLDTVAIMIECEKTIRKSNLPDVGDIVKVRNFSDVMGYAGYVSGKEEDRKKLYIRDIYPLKRKKDGKQFGYSILTQSIGSGIESRFTAFNRVFDTNPIQKGDVIICTGYERDGSYFTLTGYKKIEESA